MARFVAAMTDGLVILLVIFAVARLMSGTEGRISYLGFLALAGMILVYEPLMVSRFRGTLGHKFFGLRVVMEDERSNIPFPRAVVRSVLRWFFGTLSFFWMLGDRRQALHDRLTRTKVLNR